MGQGQMVQKRKSIGEKKGNIRKDSKKQTKSTTNGDTLLREIIRN